MADKSHEEGLIRELLKNQSLGVFATEGAGQPHTSLVAFAYTDDMKSMIIATPRATRKFENLGVNPRAALLVDNRGRGEADFHDAAAVTAYGAAREVDKEQRKDLADLYLEKHPYLVDFINSSSCALVNLVVERYSLVTNFQNVSDMVVEQ